MKKDYTGWKPKVGESFWYAGNLREGHGRVQPKKMVLGSLYWHGLREGNYFRTREEVRQACRAINEAISIPKRIPKSGEKFWVIVTVGCTVGIKKEDHYYQSWFPDVILLNNYFNTREQVRNAVRVIKKAFKK